MRICHYLWQARALGKLFEMPGDPQGTRTSYTDTVYYEDPADLGQGVDPGRVEFNFKRNPAPQGVKVYNGHRKTSNSSKPAQTNTRTDNVASNVANTHHKDAPSVDKSTPQILSPSGRPLKNLSLPRPNQCLHAFYYAWYGNPETDGCTGTITTCLTGRAASLSSTLRVDTTPLTILAPASTLSWAATAQRMRQLFRLTCSSCKRLGSV